MNKNNKTRTEKKTLINFLLFLLLCFILGCGTGGIMAAFSKDNLGALKQHLSEIMSILTPVMFIAMNVGLFIASLIFYFKAKKKYSHWDGSDENLIDSIEYQLNYPVVFSSVADIANLAFFSALIYLIENNYYAPNIKSIATLLSIFSFFAGMAWTLAIANSTVNLVKKMNPEKRGSVFDFKFQKRWEDSCDEGQKLMIYKSGYVAFKSINYTCIILWVLGFISMLSFDTGIMPVIFVCIIYIVTTVVYMVTSMKLEK